MKNVDFIDVWRWIDNRLSMRNQQDRQPPTPGKRV